MVLCEISQRESKSNNPTTMSFYVLRIKALSNLVALFCSPLNDLNPDRARPIRFDEFTPLGALQLVKGEDKGEFYKRLPKEFAPSASAPEYLNSAFIITGSADGMAHAIIGFGVNKIPSSPDKLSSLEIRANSKNPLRVYNPNAALDLRAPKYLYLAPGELSITTKVFAVREGGPENLFKKFRDRVERERAEKGSCLIREDGGLTLLF